MSCPFGKVPKTAIPVPIPVVPGSTTELSRLAAPAVPVSRPREPPQPHYEEPQPQFEEQQPHQRLEDITSLVSSIVIATDDSLGKKE